MKVVVLGGAGFIGYHLCKRLVEYGHDVTAVDDFSRGLRDADFRELCNNDNFKYESSDLSGIEDFYSLETPIYDYDCIYNLAAINGTKNFYEKPIDVIEVNFLIIMNTLLVLSSVGNFEGTLIWTSSSEVYAGNRDKMIPTGETEYVSIEDVYNSRWSYASSKILGELLCVNYARKYDMDIKIVRPHNIYGPRMGEDHVIPEFIIRALKKENPFTIHNNYNSRSFCYVDDFISGLFILAAKSKNVKDMIYNIGNDCSPIQISTLLKAILAKMDYDPEIKKIGSPEGSVSTRQPYIQKMRRLGYNPIVNLSDGIDQTIEWYRRKYGK